MGLLAPKCQGVRGWTPGPSPEILFAERTGPWRTTTAAWGEMPQHAVGDKPFASMPQLLFPGAPAAPDDGSDCTPPSRRASLGSPLRPAARRPQDSCSQPLCQPRAQKPGSRAARGARYAAVGPPSSECGWGAFAPACLQALNTPRGFLLFLCAASFLQGMTVNGFINTVITSVERRFDLHSYQSGLVAGSYDLASCLCLAFVGYFGGRGHRPRWLGWGVLLMGLGSLVFALPHFAAGPYEVELEQGLGTCPANRSGLVCGGPRRGPVRLPAGLHAGPVPARRGRHAAVHAGRHLPGRERQVQLRACLHR